MKWHDGTISNGPEKTRQTHSEKPPGNSLESAASYVCAGSRETPSHDEAFGTRQRRHQAELIRLEQWAKAHHKFGAKVFVAEDRGGEHTVAFDPKSNRYLKATRPERLDGFGIHLNNTGQGATPGEYLDRLTINNHVFEDDVCLEAVVRIQGQLSVVTSQPFVDGPPATPLEIRESMEALGFEELMTTIYYHAENGLLVCDMHPRNVVFSEGRAVPIDPVIQRVKAEFANFIRWNSHQFEG